MRTELSDEAVAFGRVARRALEAAGGDGLVRSAEADPAGRAALVEPVLAAIGAWDLDPRGSDDELEAAAALCHAAGWWAAPYPVAERLARPAGSDGLVVVDPAAPAARLAHLPDARWAAVAPGGTSYRATPRPATDPPRRTAFVTPVDLTRNFDGVGRGATTGDNVSEGLALGLVLPCWTLLGMLDRAVELTCAYVTEREQFGQALASFQGVQFQLTEAEVERAGVEELAKYALWSLTARPDEAVADALALRLAAVEAAEVEFRVTHQLHGAIGFCDETTLSWLSRHSQPLRRLPLGVSATRAALTARIGRHGLAGLYDDLAVATP